MRGSNAALQQAFRWLLVVGLVLSAWTYLGAHLAGPPAVHTGAPGEGDCAGAGCHNSFPVNSGPGGIIVSILEYLPADTLLIGVAMAGTGGSRWGFEAAVVLKYGGDLTREIVLSDPLRTQILVPPDSARYIAHTPEGTLPVVPDTLIEWQFKVVPGPIYADGGCPAVFVAAVAADGDSSPADDYTYTAFSELELHSCHGCPFTFTGDVNLSGTISSADIIALVGYTFKSGSPPQPCPAAGDVNCSETVNAGDIIALVNYVFKGGWAPCDGCSANSLLLWDC